MDTVEVIEKWSSEGYELYIDGVLIEKESYGFIPFVVMPHLESE